MPGRMALSVSAANAPMGSRVAAMHRDRNDTASCFFMGSSPPLLVRRGRPSVSSLYIK